MTTLIFTATYNERDNIEDFCTHILALDSSFHLLVVDDNSPDGTGRILDGIAQSEPRLTVVHRPRKLGLGTAHMIAMLHAVQHGYDRLVTMDADFSHLPADVPRLLAALEGADFVIGSRYMRGGHCDYRGYRRLVSSSANRATRWSLGIPLHEFTTSFRAFRGRMLRELDLAAIEAQGYSFFLESVTLIHRGGFRLAEVPIHFQDRLAGESKIPKLEIVHGMRRLLKLAANGWRRRARPQRASVAGERCGQCESSYLVERFAGSGPPTSTDAPRADAYRCTSLEHDRKPRVLACLKCGSRFVPSSDLPESLEQVYADVVDEKYLANEGGRRRTFERVFARIAPHLRERGRLLEVGCYTGVFLEVAREHGWRVEGIEPSRWASDIARRRGFEVQQGTLADGAFAERAGEYDAVVFWDVLEHVRDPRALLEQASALLRPNGVLCFSTLDISNWFPRLLGARWPWLMQMHIHYFDRAGTAELLRGIGFHVERAEPYCHCVSARYLGEKLASLVPFGIGRALAPLARLLPRRLYIPFRFGDIKLYIARRQPVHAPAHVAEPASEFAPV